MKEEIVIYPSYTISRTKTNKNKFLGSYATWGHLIELETYQA